MTADQLHRQASRKSGIKPDTLKSRIRADIVWQQLIRGRYQSQLAVSDKDILSALEAKNPEERDAVGYDYTLRPILFLVPPGSPDAALRRPRARKPKRCAAASRAATKSIPAVRAMRDVAVRDQVVRSSADLPDGAAQDPRQHARVGQLTAARGHPARHRDVRGLLARTKSKTDTPGRARGPRDAHDRAVRSRNPSAISGAAQRNAMIEYRQVGAMARALALTLGEPAGIGPDIALAAWRRRHELDLPPFYILADPRLPARAAPSGSASTCRSRWSSRRLPRRRSAPRCRWSTSASPSPPSPASPTPPARRPRSPRSDRAVADVSPARPPPSSPIRSPRTCSTGRASPSPGHTEYLAKLAERADRRSGLAGDDAVVAGARRRAGHHPPAVQGRARSG